MANIKYSDLLDDVLPHLAADPSDPVTEYAIKRAAIEFCAGSWIWKHLPDPLDIAAGESAIDLEMPSGTDITAVMDAAYDGVPLTPMSVAWLDKEIPRWRTPRPTSKSYTPVDTEQIVIAPVPDSNIVGALTLTLALQPSQTATGLPKWIANQYLYALADGAMAKLMLMPGKPWTDIPTGTDKRLSFEAATNNARASAIAALGRAPQRTTSQH